MGSAETWVHQKKHRTHRASVMSTPPPESRPRATSFPLRIRTSLSKSGLRRLAKSLDPKVVLFKPNEWENVVQKAAAAARSHPLYPIVLGGASSARRSPESSIRKIEDIVQWADTLEDFVGRTAALETFSTLVSLGEQKQRLRIPKSRKR